MVSNDASALARSRSAGREAGHRSTAGRPRARLLVVDDDEAMRDLLREELEDEGFPVEVATGGRGALQRLQRGDIQVVVSDVRMPDIDGLDLLREIQALDPRPLVVTITGFGSIDTAIRAVKLGAFDYLTKPFEFKDLLRTIERALAERGVVPELLSTGRDTSHARALIGRSPRMRELFELIRRLDGSAVSVLVTGESGTGKELVARALHHGSPRRDRPFVAVNCAAIPENLIESELFGHRRGAFTDAHADRTGLFVEAQGGTLFLDEVGDLPPSVQPKLLRALQEREVRPVGAARPQSVDVRVIAATNRDLELLLREGRFREDLYYRLNVVEMKIPPLRERPEDVLPLAEHFLARAAQRTGKTARGFDEDVRRILATYSFPGNVRELENMVERAVALARGPMIAVGDLPASWKARPSSDRLAEALAQGLTLDELERRYIEKVLEAEGGNKTRAAQRLGLDRRTLYRKLDEYAQGHTPRQDTGEPE
ncbi:MAG: sigma-54 dependent transcriptional regulator [Myxococcales bacterium]|nr:sigma-54 dependent transcriptional regulator [Myxococcales bacterium]